MEKELFGKYQGRDVHRYTLSNGILTMSILDWGCVIQRLVFDGADVECGFDRFEEYADCRDYYGSTIGRYANRIANARLKLGEREYRLTVNDFGTNCNHGGVEAFNRRVWDAEPVCDDGREGIAFSLVSPDGDGGFPGELRVRVTFLLDGASLVVRYEATGSEDTVVNMTNHSYFNIDGYDSGVILDHTLRVYADRVTELDPLRRVTGKQLPILGTEMDLSDGPRIGERIDAPHPQLEMIGGYGHNYIISADAPKETYRGRALLRHCEYASKTRRMTVFSDKPCLQVYTANRIGGHANFKGDTPVIPRSAVCLEPQFEPDCCNKGEHILRAGEKYDYLTVYRFDRIG